MPRTRSVVYFIVPRRTPDWRRLAETYRDKGHCAEADYIPDVLPPGFPLDLRERIDLWNTTFKLDFFACRARLAEMATASWSQMANAVVLEDKLALQDAISENIGAAKRFLFVDDDDWFAPNLPALLESQLNSSAAIVRWAAPLFNGRWSLRLQPTIFPRLWVRAYIYARRRHLLEAVYRRSVRYWARFRARPLVPADHILYTNNYAVTERYLDYFNDFGCVADHSDAARLVMVSNLRLQSKPRLMLSVTNKHPCSAGLIGRLAEGPDRSEFLARQVEQYLLDGRAAPAPQGLAWSDPYVQATLELFGSAL